MLLYRSIFLQVCLFLTLTQCQDYETGYSVDESDDHSQVQENSGHPDYSKYYAVDTSAPLVSAQGNQEGTGLLSPIDFSGFFPSSVFEFGASEKQEVAEARNPFAQEEKKTGFLSNQHPFPEFGVYPVDYFEQAQRQQQKENNEEIDDDFAPKYISAHLSPNIEGDFSSKIKKVEPKPEKKKQTEKYHSRYLDAAKDASTESDKYKVPDYSYEYKPSAKFTDYNVGKSSSTVAQQPQAAGYFEKNTQAPTATPYQKYSFQPVTDKFKSKYLGDLISTVAPFNPSYNKVASTAAPTVASQPSENIPSHLKDKNCRRIKKDIPSSEGHDRRKRDAMNCYVCEDPANKSKFTQCSYAVEPEPINAYSGISERYSIPPKPPTGFRFKRYSGGDYTDPYDYIKSRTQKYFDEPKEIKEYEEYKIPDFSNDDTEKALLEIQAEAISANPANCHKEESKGMTCTICKDPTTGGNFEQCSYTAEPKEQKYAYVTEKKYDNNDEPAQGSESKPAVQTQAAEPTKQPQEVSSKSSPTEQASTSNGNGQLSKIEEFKPSEHFENSFRKSTNPSIQFSNSDNYHKSSNAPEHFQNDHHKTSKPAIDNDNHDKFSKLENFKPVEDYKASYHGHDKFKLSDQYSDFQKDDNSKKEPLGNFKQGQQTSEANPRKLVDDDPYQIPKHFAESTINEQKLGGLGLVPSLYGSADSSEVEDNSDASSKSDPYKDIDEYHFRLFPEFSKQESQHAEVVANKNPAGEPSRKEVEEVLAEFSRKDRSACKKAEKKGMTCYLCVDKKGIQHEECMYVQESKPQASHVAYHEVQQLKAPDNQNQQQPQQQQLEQASSEVKKVASTAAPYSLVAAASHEVETKVKYTPPKKQNRRRNAKKVKEEEEAEEEPKRSASNQNIEKLKEEADEPKAKETPREFIVGDEEGAFSAETRPVYSKRLGVKLPRYMIEKSEFEKEFDDFAGNPLF